MHPDNKKIAKNSFVLYTRLIVTTLIGLYSTRIILLQLGAQDYGLYAVIGGIVTLMNFMNTSMIATSNRFLAVELGKNNGGDLNRIFNTLLVFHIFFSLILIFLVEVLGVWYIENYLNILPNKIPDALFILHISVITTAIATVTIPYQGLITVYEKFNIRASIEIIRSILHLASVLLLSITLGNKLKLYVIFILIIQIIEALFYYYFSIKKTYNAIRIRINKVKQDYINISRFFGWQMLYISGNIGVKQGSNLIINFFFGTVLNAAFAISTKVNDFVFSFVKNLNQAAVPQIIKSYSSGNESRTMFLIYKLSKYTFFIMLVPAVPIILSIDSILKFWLDIVPPYTSWFVVLRIVHGLISCLESGFDAAIDATGKIRKTKIIFTVIFLMLLPLLFYLYKLGFSPYTVTILFIIGEIIFILFQLTILKTLTTFSIKEYLVHTILPLFYVIVLLTPQFYLMSKFNIDNFGKLLIISIITAISTSITIFVAGLNSMEKDLVTKQIFKIIKFNKIFK